MKKLTTISLFIFGVVVAAILTAGLVFYQNNTLNNTSSNLTGNNSGKTSSGGKAAETTILNLAEISKHNSIGDCWLIINDKVYNVTSYLSVHPGGAGAMTPYCGKEASQAFATKDKNTPHSDYAESLLVNYYLGNLNQTINPAQIQQNVNNTNSVQLPARDGESKNKDEEDDDWAKRHTIQPGRLLTYWPI